VSDLALMELQDLINNLWIETYGGSPVHNIEAIKARVTAIFDDRNSWHDNAAANQKEYLKLEKKIKKLENE
jgi:hypothetical protein